MKKIIVLVFAILTLLNATPCFALDDEGSGLISGIQVTLKNAETPKRLEVSFDLAESIDLSNGDSDIIFEFLTADSTGNPEVVQYRKDKTWSGYLNSYDNYPAGERKYSSGASNDAYPDNVPGTRLYTSTKTNQSIDVTLVGAVRITVLRADGSGEAVTVDSDGTVVHIETIAAPEKEQNKSAGIMIDSIDSYLPSGTEVVADEIVAGPVYEKINSLLTNASDFIVIDINLRAGGSNVQPDGKVKISIPVPEHFNLSNLAVYRISNDLKTSYPVTVTTDGETNYATFESEHFSIYVLAEESETPAESVPETTTPSDRTSRLRVGNEGNTAGYNNENMIEINENEVPLSNAVPATGAADYGAVAGIGFVLTTLSLIIGKWKKCCA